MAQLEFFARSSEKSSQGCLINEAEQDAAALPEGDEFDAIPDKPKSKAKKRGRKSLSAHLQRKRVEHDLPESETVCGCCHGELHRMGEERSKQRDIIAATPPLLRPRAS